MYNKIVPREQARKSPKKPIVVSRAGPRNEAEARNPKNGKAQGADIRRGDVKERRHSDSGKHEEALSVKQLKTSHNNSKGVMQHEARRKI